MQDDGGTFAYGDSVMTGKLRLAMLTAALAVGLSSQASAQSILERLEKRLNDAGVPLPAQVPNRVERANPQPAAAPRGGYLGLTADTKNGAVEVISVRAGGPADTAGVKPGDRVVSVGGVEIVNLDDMAAIVEKIPSGSNIEFVVSRGGREQKVSIMVAARDPAPAEELPNPRDEEFPQERELAQPRATLGVRALPVTVELQRRYGLVVRRGAVIESVQPGSPADRYGLPIGAAITSVDGARVDTPDDLAAIIAGARPGDTVEISYYQRDQVFRKKVRLVPVEGGVVAPAPGEDRPLLRRLERALGDPPAFEDDVISAMQERIDAMQAKIDALESQLRELEARLPNPDIKEATPLKEPELSPPLKPLEP